MKIIKLNRKEIGARIKVLMDQKAIGAGELADKLTALGHHIKRDAIQRWRRGETMPRGTILIQTASILDTTESYILSGENEIVYRDSEVWQLVEAKNIIISNQASDIHTLMSQVKELKLENDRLVKEINNGYKKSLSGKNKKG